MKKKLLIESLLIKLKLEKDDVNACLITGDYTKIQKLQQRAFFTAKALRKLLK
jgi:hypothetical protein